MLSQRQPSWALEITGLTKRFERPADGLDLTVRRASLARYSGRTARARPATLKMVVGLLAPDAGAISVLGIDALADPVAAKQVMAWISDEPMIYDKLTPFEYLEFVAGLWGIDGKQAAAAANELIDWLGLRPHAHERCEGFSSTRQRRARRPGTTASSFSMSR